MRARRRNEVDRGIRGWIVNTAKRNQWRVAATHELEDLISEGYVCYSVCKLKYEHIREPSHFMALFKTTFINEIHTLSTKASRRVDAPLANYDQAKFSDIDQALEALAGPQPEEQTLAVMVASLPAEIRELLRLLASDAKDIPMLVFANGKRETDNEYLWRLIKQAPRGINLEDAFRSHFAAA